MATRYFFASLTRISNLPAARFSVARLPKSQWATGVSGHSPAFFPLKKRRAR